MHLTIPDELASHFVVLLHQSQVQSGTISHLIIRVVKASSQQHIYAALHLRIFLTDTELR